MRIDISIKTIILFFIHLFSFFAATQYVLTAKCIVVSPTGADNGIGTYSKPIDVLSMFYGKTDIIPGDTVWLKGGVYKGEFECCLQGTSNKPILIASYPGEWAIIQGNLALHPRSHYVTFMNFEITGDYSEKKSRVLNLKSESKENFPHSAGITVGIYNNFGTKIINLLIHDVPGVGIANWERAINTEVYGNIIYNNGYDGIDRGHGHGIYSQNDTGTKKYEDNIFFWNLGGYGIQIYSQDGNINNFYLEGNVVFNGNKFLVGGFKPANNITVVNNYLGEGSLFSLGYTNIATMPNHNLVAKGNYIQNVLLLKWDYMVFKNNKIFKSLNISPLPWNVDTGYVIDSNLYFDSSKIAYRKNSMDFAAFNNAGFDKNGSYSSTYPNNNEVIIRPNKYENGRANIIIYNWAKEPKVDVNLTRILKIGDAFEIKDVQNYSGKPVIKGIYNGELVSVPMMLNEVDTLLSDFTGCYHPKLMKRNHSSPVFGVFVVRKK